MVFSDIFGQTNYLGKEKLFQKYSTGMHQPFPLSTIVFTGINLSEGAMNDAIVPKCQKG
jgi:hypothetical protein